MQRCYLSSGQEQLNVLIKSDVFKLSRNTFPRDLRCMSGLCWWLLHVQSAASTGKCSALHMAACDAQVRSSQSLPKKQELLSLNEKSGLSDAHFHHVTQTTK